VIEDAQRAGIIDPQLDSRHLLLTFLAMADWIFVSPQHVRLIFGRDPDEELLEKHAQFLEEIARRIARRDDGDAVGGAG